MPAHDCVVKTPVPSGTESRARDIPSLRAFMARADEICWDEGMEAFARCEAPFTDLVRSSFLTELVNHELSRIVRDPFVIPAGLRTSTAFDVARTPQWTLSVRIMAAHRPPDEIIWSSAEHFMLGVPARGAGELAFGRFEQPAPEPSELFEPDRGLLSRGTITAGPGEVRSFRAGADILRPASLPAPAVLMVLTSATVLPFRWGYDARSLRPQTIAASAGASWRLEYAMRLLAAFGDATAVPVLTSLARHADHFIRWTAIRAVLALDPAAGTALLEAAATDPHRDIRQAAQDALSSMQDTAQERTEGTARARAGQGAEGL